MATAHDPELITYVDSSNAAWQEFRPGSRRKVLYEDAATGQVTMLVQWDPGYRMGIVEHHEYDEHLYILAGTFVDHNRRVRAWHVHLESGRLGAPMLYP